MVNYGGLQWVVVALTADTPGGLRWITRDRGGLRWNTMDHVVLTVSISGGLRENPMDYGGPNCKGFVVYNGLCWITMD